MHRLSIAVITAVSTIALTQIASAADLPVKAAPAPLPLPPVISWTGWYVGLNAGGTWGGDDVNTSASNVQVCDVAPCNGGPETAEASVLGAIGSFPGRTDGFIGGGQFGFNWQFANSWVAGFETDIQGIAGAKTSHSATSEHVLAGFPANSVASDLTVTKRINWLGTVRGRLGYLVTPTFLVYGTGGFAYGGVKSSTSISQAITGPTNGIETSWNSFSSLSKTRGGWTVGGGFDWMFSPNWSARVEYLYYDLGEVSYDTQLVDSFTAPAPAPAFFTNNVQTKTRFNGNIVRAAVNYHF